MWKVRHTLVTVSDTRPWPRGTMCERPEQCVRAFTSHLRHTNDTVSDTGTGV
jgi:hypothetical protein